MPPVIDNFAFFLGLLGILFGVPLVTYVAADRLLRIKIRLRFFVIVFLLTLLALGLLLPSVQT